MRATVLRSLALTAGLVLAAAGAAADAAKKSAVDILFESPHLSLMQKGSEAAYRIQRTVSDAKLLGEPFSDDIKIGVKAVDTQGKREVEIKVFSGERARDPRIETEMTGNPILVFFLDRSVMNFALVGGGNRNYLKQQFRDALRTKADIQEAKVAYEGQTVDGYRVTVTPFADDKNASKMMGYEGSRFSFLVSDKVPGYFVEMTSSFESKLPDAPKFEERVSLAKVEGLK